MSNAHAHPARAAASEPPARLTARQRQVLEFIDAEIRERGYPPSVREIGEAVGLSSPSTVHAHLAALQDKGYLRRDPTKPRAIEISLEPSTGAAIERRPVAPRPAPRRRRGRHRRARGRERRRDAAGARPTSRGDGDLFMLRVRGESMIDAGIFDGDYVVVRSQPDADNGDIVVAGIPGEEATVKTFLRKRNKIVLRPSNATMDDLVFDPTTCRSTARSSRCMRRL